MIHRHDTDPDVAEARVTAAGWAVTGAVLAHTLAMSWTTAALTGLGMAGLHIAAFTGTRAAVRLARR